MASYIVTATGGSSVRGERRWLTSQRAELQGLLSVLMGVVAVELSGWRGSLVLRLDNQAAAVTSTSGEVSFDGIGTDDWLLASTDKMADSDLVNEIAAWKKRHLDERRSGEAVQVRLKRGRPEKHKCSRGTDWDMHGRGIYEADLVADEYHTTGRSVQMYDEMSHQPKWCLWWRGTKLIGQMRKKVVEAMRVEMLAKYQSHTAGSGQHPDWICVPSASTLVRQSGTTLARRVLKAKMLSYILGTTEVKLMRGHARLDESLVCRMCGRNLETVSHVMWECGHESAATPRGGDDMAD